LRRLLQILLSAAALALLTAHLASQAAAPQSLQASAALLAASLALAALPGRGMVRRLGEAEEAACGVCSHPRRAEAEEKVEAGSPLQEVAEEMGLRLEELAAHMALHSGRRPGGGGEPGRGLSLEEELNKLLQELKEMYESLKGLEAEQLRIQDHLRVVSERRGLLRDIRLLVLLLAGLRQGKGAGRDLAALVRILRRIGSPGTEGSA